jgi:hypothetical protein
MNRPGAMRKTVYAAFTLALATVVFGADLPDFTGNWRLDASKMDNSNGPPPRITRRVEKDGNILTLTEVQTRDGKQTAIVRRFSTDGSIVTSALNGQREKSHGMWDGNALVSDTTIGENINVHDVWTLSDNGQIWTNDIVFNGKPAKLVFIRQYIP